MTAPKGQLVQCQNDDQLNHWLNQHSDSCLDHYRHVYFKKKIIPSPLSVINLKLFIGFCTSPIQDILPR